jgi:TP53 regulating kinase-like protein
MPDLTPLFCCKKLTKNFGGLKAVDGVDLKVSEGEILGLMHEGGAVHGDLTISNVLSENGKLFMIDFGLGNLSDQIEDKGVDLVLLNRAIKSTHYAIHVPLFKAFLKGYSTAVGKRGSQETLHKMREIERRGRYVDRT